jgi:hypothetical protein
LCVVVATGAMACGVAHAQDGGGEEQASAPTTVARVRAGQAWALDELHAMGGVLRAVASWLGLHIEGDVLREAEDAEGEGRSPVRLNLVFDDVRLDAEHATIDASAELVALAPTYHDILDQMSTSACCGFEYVGVAVDLNAVRRALDGPFSATRFGRALDSLGLANARAVGLGLWLFSGMSPEVIASWSARSSPPDGYESHHLTRQMPTAKCGLGWRADVGWLAVRRVVRRALVESRTGEERREFETRVRRFEARAGVAIDVLIRSFRPEVQLVLTGEAANETRLLIVVPLRENAREDVVQRSLDRIFENVPTAARGDGPDGIGVVWRVGLQEGDDSAAVRIALVPFAGDGMAVVVTLTDEAMALAPEAPAPKPAKLDNKP